jgi:hypothetical protein
MPGFRELIENAIDEQDFERTEELLHTFEYWDPGFLRAVVNRRASHAFRERVFMLMVPKIDVNHRFENGKTLLHLAAAHGMVRAVSMLLRAGADADVYDGLHRTPLMSACLAAARDPDGAGAANGNTKAICLHLALASANLSATDVWGLSARDYAARLGETGDRCIFYILAAVVRRRTNPRKRTYAEIDKMLTAPLA